MASKAREAFDENAKDVDYLLKLHTKEGGDKPGRRDKNLNVLHKSAIVLVFAFWEAYCEDVISEAVDHIIKQARSPEDLNKNIKKKIHQKIKESQHEMESWNLAGVKWKNYTRDKLNDAKKELDRQFANPRASKVEKFFNESIDLSDIRNKWKWTRMSTERAEQKLDELAELRGAIAHRGRGSSNLHKSAVTDSLKHVQMLVEKTDDAVNNHVKEITGKFLWNR